MMSRGLCRMMVLLLALPSLAGASDELFENEIRPVLVQVCFPCHGGKKTGGGLRVDSREALLKGGDRGPAVVPKDPERSPLIEAIRHTTADFKMPPSKPLIAGNIAAFNRWIAEGAIWPAGTATAAGQGGFQATRHWAFEAVKAFEPQPDPSGWSTYPIDRFIAAGHRARGLTPAAEADRRTLIRRVTFDLTGLPPTPDETARFLDDGAPSAYAHLVERLLASSRYGERWGRHWMDVVHYADTAGDNADYPVPELVRYRERIIAAFNADEPFDRFIREQLAGDILAGDMRAPRSVDQVVATGYLALARRYATAPFELWHLTLEDAIETTGRAFLGLSLRCARCHDHKYDPVTQRDYYALYGIFASTTFPYAGSEEFVSKKFPRLEFRALTDPGTLRRAVETRDRRLKEVEAEIGRLEKAPGELGRVAKLRRELTRLKRSGLPPEIPCAYAVAEGKPVDVALQKGGDPGRPGPVVPRGVPRFPFLDGGPPPPTPPGSSGRLALAEWLTRPDNPLTPRVLANRIWQYHFGRGLVATPSNFGIRGEPPSHPELLDWLAHRLVKGGWSIKELHRQILLSRTYRMSSDFDSANSARDPGNRSLWRFDRRRLEAESIRDAMLAVSGNLDATTPKPHPFPPIEDWPWTQHNAFKEAYPSRHRSVYLMTQRLVKLPFLAIFDGPDTNSSTDLRARSTVPLQALFLMNNSFVAEQARGLAERLIRREADETRRIELAQELTWNRPASSADVERWLRFLRACDAELARAGTPADRVEPGAWSSLAKVMITANEFLYVD